MEMIDAYIVEVGQRLPAKPRADIEREIRSMIEDTLDDESRTQDRPVDEAMAAQVLKRLGSPQKLAASYAPPQFLIGPALFPVYLLVVKIVVSVLAILAIVGLAVSVGLAGTVQSSVLNSFAQAAGGIFTGIFQAFGIITFIFAIIQRVAPKNKLALDDEEFDPRSLKLKPDKEKINRSGLIVEIVFTFIGISIFAFFPQIIGVWSFRDGQWVIVSILSQAFYGYLPYMVALWAAQAVLAVVLLASGRWTTATRWTKVGLNILSIVLLGVILSGPSLVVLPPDIVTNLGALVDGSIRLGLVVGVIVQSIETITSFVKLVLHSRPAVVTD
jgi:hypothetical protein